MKELLLVEVLLIILLLIFLEVLSEHTTLEQETWNGIGIQFHQVWRSTLVIMEMQNIKEEQLMFGRLFQQILILI